MNWWTKFGCMLTGWNYELLSQCSVASRSQLNKYTSALLILIVIWGITGFCFAQRYIGLPWWGCSLVSMAFITIVIMIERQIILTLEKTYKVVVFRILIAVIMAVVGSTIFDQYIFGKDIDKQMQNIIEQQVAELTPKRVGVIEKKLSSLKVRIDSIDKVNSLLQVDVEAHPFIIQTSVTTIPIPTTMPDGATKVVNKPSVTKTEVPNPKIDQLNENRELVKQQYLEEKELTAEMQRVEESTRQECKENVGFLEELEAMWTIISTRKLAGGFYLVFFCLLMSMELFVVMSKIGDKECDYEVALKGAQKVKIFQFGNAYARVNASSVEMKNNKLRNIC